MHPAVCFLYLAAVLGITAFSGSAAVAAISLAGAISLAAASGGVNAGLPLGAAGLAAIANFLFVHNGKTVLFFAGDTAFTLEALIYGIAFGVKLAAVCVWSVCSVRFITSDKYIWLFGRIFPSAGLVLSCAVRFIPLFVRTTREFIAVRTVCEPHSGGLIRGYLRSFSAAVGYSAERAMDSAMSMKARGYGTARRTSFSLYRFTIRTAAAAAAVVIIVGACAVLLISGVGKQYYYPALSEIPADTAAIVLYSVFAVLCLIPSVVVIFNERRIGAVTKTQQRISRG